VKTLYLIIILTSVIIFSFSCNKFNDYSETDVLLVEPLLGVVTGKTFYYAFFDENSIIFKNETGTIIGSNKLSVLNIDIIKKRNIKYLKKYKDNILFVLDGAIDDEWGILYSDNNMVDFEGLWHVSRINRNWFSFSTIK